MSEHLIINADDFGRDENMSRAIALAFKEHLITQTTLMVNMPWVESAVRLARQEGFANRVGLHLNLTEGIPLTKGIARFDECCDEFGRFRGRFVSADELRNHKLKAAVVAEIEAQVEKYLSLGLTMLHCDGHHHVQARLQIAKLLMPILKKYGFKTIRRPINVWNNPFAPHIRSRIEQFRFQLLSWMFGVKSTAKYFGGWGTPVERLIRKGNDNVEIMVHPRIVDNAIIDVTDFRENKGRDLREIVNLSVRWSK